MDNPKWWEFRKKKIYEDDERIDEFENKEEESEDNEELGYGN
ncbi:MAG: hypothetical protein ACI9CD_000530, partial [Candidatus Deianiraeaceae bacterium]